MTISIPGTSYRLHVAEGVLEDLARRLEHTRLPREQAGPDWATGTPIGYASRLLDHWRNRFDWRAFEERINRYDNRMVELDGQNIHVLVEQGSGPAPYPLVLTNGWPGSFLEYLDIIDALAHPERHGGNEEDAFTVIIPSLPGYGLSPAPDAPISPKDIAALWSRLLREEFGCERFGALGSDWGSLVTALWAKQHPEGLDGIFLTMAAGVPYFGEGAKPMSDAEIAWQQAAGAANMREGAYQALQGTKPQSLAYGFADSPVALAAWISEKFRGWSAPDDNGDPPVKMDDLLANIMLYWVNGATAPMWLYMLIGEYAQPAADMSRCPVPAGFMLGGSDFIPPAPREWMERSFEVAHYNVSPTGGHFPGYDNPEMLVSDLRAFFRPLR